MGNASDEAMAVYEKFKKFCENARSEIMCGDTAFLAMMDQKPCREKTRIVLEREMMFSSGLRGLPLLKAALSRQVFLAWLKFYNMFLRGISLCLTRHTIAFCIGARLKLTSFICMRILSNAQSRVALYLREGAMDKFQAERICGGWQDFTLSIFRSVFRSSVSCIMPARRTSREAG